MDNSEPDKVGGKVSALQNVPKKLRDIVTADQGKVLVGSDFAGIEWAICMWMASKVSRDGFHLKVLDEYFQGQFDPHIWLAAHAFGVPVEQVSKEQRQTAKVFTHGYNYDGSPRALARNAGLPDAIGLKVCQAHDRAFKTRPWKDSVVASMKKQHYVQTPLGWRVYNWAWNPKPQEALAWLVQGTAADLCKYVMLACFKGMPEGWEMITSTHDSLVLQVPAEDGERAKGWLTDMMEQPIPWLDGRKWRCETKVGPTWRDV